MIQKRRDFIKTFGTLTLGAGAVVVSPQLFAFKKSKFDISLAQWSLHKSLFAGKLDNLNFPVKAKKDFDINIVEYVNVFFNKKEKDTNYLKELLLRSQDNGVFNHLIMVDGEGDLASFSDKERLKSVENHYKWIDAIKFLGGKSIRVNASGHGNAADVKAAAIDGLGKLTEYGQKNKINVIVENHGGLSSNGAWLADVIKQVNNKYCGTLPDFGNFRINDKEEYDKYLGVQDLMPYAKGVSAKTYNLNDKGYETDIDYDRMFEIINESRWRGIIGIEYEGDHMSEDEGIRATKKLIERYI